MDVRPLFIEYHLGILIPLSRMTVTYKLHIFYCCHVKVSWGRPATSETYGTITGYILYNVYIYTFIYVYNTGWDIDFGTRLLDELVQGGVTREGPTFLNAR